MSPLDEVRFVLQNAHNFAFVALQNRVVIARYGLVAGAAFGGRSAQFPYSDIVSISVSKGMLNATIEIHTAAHQANSVGDYWGGIAQTGSGTSPSPHEAPNAFPCDKKLLKAWKLHLDELNGYIAEARDGGVSAPEQATFEPADLSQRLSNLTQLHADGALSDDEFNAAKAQILGL